MSDAGWKLLALLGAVAVVVGLYLGFSKVTVPAINMVQDCGSAFSPTAYKDVAGSFVVAECDSKRQDRKTIALVAIIAGAIVGGYGFRQSTLTATDVLHTEIWPSRKRAPSDVDD